MHPFDRRLTNLQWQLNLVTGLFSAVAIGLYFADQRGLAQLCLVLVALSFLGSVVVATMRYQRNKKRRDEVLAQFERDRNVKLEELFDQARKMKNLPPDTEDRTGFRATIQAGQERIDALEKKRKDGGKSGDK
ncbi:MAG: hypothetical protein WCS37_11820 [Chloroflexota bacterium]|nr:hypothetical protein [Chloroflexota bacterium]